MWARVTLVSLLLGYSAGSLAQPLSQIPTEWGWIPWILSVIIIALMAGIAYLGRSLIALAIRQAESAILTRKTVEQVRDRLAADEKVHGQLVRVQKEILDRVKFLLEQHHQGSGG